MEYKMKFIHEIYWKLVKKDRYRIQRKTRALPLHEIKRIQWHRLKQLLNYVYTNTDYYRDIFNSLKLTPSDIIEPADLMKLPVTEKNTYRKNFEKVTNQTLSKKDYFLSSTSGSTGEPFKFFTDLTSEGPNLSAAYLCNKESMGIDPFKRFNILEIKQQPRNEIKNFPNELNRKIKKSLKDLFKSKIYGLSTWQINEKNTDHILRLFKNLNIHVINGYSSTIFSIAQLFKKRNVNYQLRYINTIGESCIDQQKEFISEVFNCPVYRDYSSSECLHMGTECRNHDGYHLDMYNYYFEFLNGGRPAKNGEYGDIVVTNLNNYVFPFIRYKIGDSALLSDIPCTCGNNFPVVKQILGRSSEAIKTKSGTEMTNIHIPIAFDHFYEYIRQYQLIQISEDILHVKIVPTKIMNENILREIENVLSDALDGSIKIDIQLVENIIPSKSGKKKVIITKEEYKRLIAFDRV